MATYECSLCGMSVNATCGKCNEPLVDDTIDADGFGSASFKMSKWSRKN